MPKNPFFYSFDSFLIVSLTALINKTRLYKRFNYFIVSFISPSEIIKLYPKLFFWIGASVADSAAINPKSTIFYLIAFSIIPDFIDSFYIISNQNEFMIP